MVLCRAGPLQATVFQPRICDTVTGFPDAADFFPDFFRRLKSEKVAFAHRASELADNFPVTVASPSGSMALRTRWMRRSEFMNTPRPTLERRRHRKNTDPYSFAISFKD